MASRWPYIPKTRRGGAEMWHLHNRCELGTVDCRRAHSEMRNMFVQKLMCHPNIYKMYTIFSTVFTYLISPILDKCSLPSCTSSQSLPGVATTISGPDFKTLSCFATDIPPTITATLMSTKKQLTVVESYAHSYIYQNILTVQLSDFLLVSRVLL